MAILIKRSDWNYYKKYPGYTKEVNGRKFLLFGNGINDFRCVGWQEVKMFRRGK
jgi:hypothetical protein